MIMEEYIIHHQIIIRTRTAAVVEKDAIELLDLGDEEAAVTDIKKILDFIISHLYVISL